MRQKHLQRYPLTILRRIGILLVAAGFFFVFLQIILTFFAVKTVLITGNPRAISDLTFLKQKRNLLFSNSTQLVQDLRRTYPNLEEVTIEKKFPSTLVIHYTVRQPVAEYIGFAGPAFFDEHGVLAPLDFDQKTLPMLECNISENLSSPLDRQVAFALWLAKRFNQTIGEKILKIV